MDLQTELDAHEMNLKDTATVLPYVTAAQVSAIVGLMRQVIPDRNERIAVLKLLVGPAMRKVAGVEVESTKNLTGKMATYLIEQLREPGSKPWRLSRYGQELLECAKARVEAPPVS